MTKIVNANCFVYPTEPEMSVCAIGFKEETQEVLITKVDRHGWRTQISLPLDQMGNFIYLITELYDGIKKEG